MKLHNQKFYNEKNEVIPIEIGNTEQIALLKEIGAIKPINESETEEDYIADVQVSFEQKHVVEYGIIFFTCFCGNKIEEYSDEEYSDEYCYGQSDVLRDFRNQEIECDCCNRVYKINGKEAVLIKNN